MTSWKRRHGKRGNDRRYQDPKVPVHARRRSRNASRRDVQPPRQPSENENISIEEQLQRQRRKRLLESSRASSKDDESSPTESKPKARLGNFRYDPERDAYFPAAESGRGRRPSGKTLSDSNESRPAGFEWNDKRLSSTRPPLQRDTSLIQNGMLSLSIETCVSARRCRQLRSLWVGRVVQAGMQVVPAVVPTKEKGQFATLLRPLRSASTDTSSSLLDDSNMPSDLDCKYSFHSAARTMDIHMGSKSTEFPSIATLFKGGCSIRFARQPTLCKTPPDENDECDLSLTPLKDTGESPPHLVRFSPQRVQNASSLCFAFVSRMNRGTDNACRIWRCGEGNELDSFHAESPTGINDLAFHPHFHSRDTTMILATNYSRSMPRSDYGPQMLDLTRMEITYPQVIGFPRSDALRAEYLGSNATALFGHRNGTMSVVDFRSTDICTLGCRSGDNKRGSISGIKVLNARDDATSHLFLAKHSFGSCSLFDVRRMGGSSSNKTAALVFHLDAGPGVINIDGSSRCTGIALDPLESLAISPFSDKNHRACLGFWSISSGVYLGSRCLTGSGEAGSVLGDQTRAICELSDTITPAWKLGTDSDGEVTVETTSGWGLWFKCGGLPVQRPPSLESVGSIHHVTFPGGVLRTEPS